jgi:2'-5' RNA ligase
MRAFIALELSKEIKKELEKVQNQLKKAGVRATWVKPEIVHLTLAFLGSITPNQVETIHKVLEEKTGKSSSLRLEQIGCFPRPEKARIIFIDLRGDLKELNNLTKQIRQGLKKEKIWFDNKPPIAHITIGRVKKRSNLTDILKGIKVNKIKFLAREISLNQSTLGHSGPKYTKLKICHLT